MPSAAAPAPACRLARPAALARALPVAAAVAAAAVPPLHAAVVEVQVSTPAGQPLAEAVVMLDSREARAALRPLAGAEMAQEHKRFTQRVLVVPLGTAVQFPNRDTVRHHVYSLSPAKTFEIKLYSGVPANPVLFDRPGVAVLGCNIHDSMVAWVVVAETPHHAQTGRDGRVRLEGVPPGSYTLRTWHPDLPVGAPAQQQALAVPAGGVQASVQASVQLALPGAAR